MNRKQMNEKTKQIERVKYNSLLCYWDMYIVCVRVYGQYSDKAIVTVKFYFCCCCECIETFSEFLFANSARLAVCSRFDGCMADCSGWMSDLWTRMPI